MFPRPSRAAAQAENTDKTLDTVASYISSTFSARVSVHRLSPRRPGGAELQRPQIQR